MENNKTNGAAYALLRIAMGINMLGHGAARIPKLQAFSDGMVQNMSKGWLPEALVKPWGIVLPFVEFFIGLFLILGLFTQKSLYAGAILILILLFGSSTIENWEAMGTQMIYAFLFYLLIIKIQDNKYALDVKLKARTDQAA